MLIDLHVHSCISDGDLKPTEVLDEAAGRGIGRLSIADHDSLGAYAWEGGVIFDEARRLGIDLIVGVELDALMDGQEVHLLGYEVERGDSDLRDHLASVKAARLERARREFEIVIERLGSAAIDEVEVFRPARETYMRPHFIQPMLKRKLFPSYEEANAWFKANVQSGVVVPKPSVEEAIRLVHCAGGWACLAHPAYYGFGGERLAERLAELRSGGLDGVEVVYPYHACSPRLFDEAAEAAFVARIRDAGEALGLRLTRGSDCHTLDDFVKVYG
ncbi:MAG: PHP domain-containing protein [Vicinamibacteria bacterium]|nr:PHP domain-containing protein [Vicinamibacteria bacterium]